MSDWSAPYREQAIHDAKLTGENWLQIAGAMYRKDKELQGGDMRAELAKFRNIMQHKGKALKTIPEELNKRLSLEDLIERLKLAGKDKTILEEIKKRLPSGLSSTEFTKYINRVLETLKNKNMPINHLPKGISHDKL